MHRVGELLILEFEPTEAWDSTGPHALRNAMFALESAPNLRALAEVATQTVRELTGFDRVMLYKFAPDATGEVIAEARREGLHAFLGHRFPASDIPAQARALYTRHLLRLTADTRAAAVPLDPVLNPQTNAPTPLGGAVLRATSPMHMQYLRNMGVGSSLSVSVVVGGQLWGLIACHHQTPYVLPPDLRTTLEYLGRLLSLQVQVKEAADVAAFRQSLREHHARVALAAAHSLSPHDTLSDPALDLLGLMRAGGLILRFEGRWQTLGEVPPAPAVDALLAWLETQPGALVQTDALGQLWPAGADLAPSAAGLLAISVGEGWSECLVWLRPELRLEVAWGGATPDQAKDDLGPRHSFDTYLEEKRGYAEPWHPGEIEEAQDLRDTLTGALGERLSVIRDLNRALTQSNAEWRQYGFVISHHMQEPVRLISQFAELLTRQPRAQDGSPDSPQTERITGFLLRETSRLRSLTQDLHTYTALLSAPPPVRRPTPLGRVVDDVLQDLEPRIADTGASIEVAPELPVIAADAGLLRDLLLHLIGNALTFGGPEPRIAVRTERQGAGWSIAVSDQGAGIAPEYQERIFLLFQRLGSLDEALGNGLGLPLCRKIAELHGGTLTVESAPGEGSTFRCWLPDAGPLPGAADA